MRGFFVTVILSAASATGNTCIQSSFNFRVLASAGDETAYRLMKTATIRGALRRTLTSLLAAASASIHSVPTCKVLTSGLLYFLRHRLTKESVTK